jgi:hypothetical protein
MIKVKRKYILLLGLLVVICFNLLVTYGLLWNPYRLYFHTPEFSDIYFKTRDNYALSALVLHFILLWGSSIWAIILWVKKSKLSLIAPIVSGLTLLVFMEMQSHYPDMNSEWSKDGHQYKVQKWYLDGDKAYKRWKSKDPIKTYNSTKEIVWVLDSMYVE